MFPLDLRIYGRDGETSTISQHGSLNAGIIYLNHEGTRDARALFYSQRGLEIFILLSNTDITEKVKNQPLCKVSSFNVIQHVLLLPHWWDSS